MLKVDLHMHSSEDPRDALDYDARDLICHAAKLNFDAIALTLHGKVHADEDLKDFASSRGLILIPGIEKRIHGKEVLVYNVTQSEIDQIQTFDDLRELKIRKKDGILIIAPHPFFRRAQCLGRALEENLDLFDGIEYCHLYTRFWNLNKRAAEIARRHGKPLVATSDAHALWMFGNNYTMVDAPRTMEGIFDGIRKGRVHPHSRPIAPWALVHKLGWFFLYHTFRKMMRRRAARRQPEIESERESAAEPNVVR